LEKFAHKELLDGGVVVFNGFRPTLKLREILSTVAAQFEKPRWALYILKETDKIHFEAIWWVRQCKPITEDYAVPLQCFCITEAREYFSILIAISGSIKTMGRHCRLVACWSTMWKQGRR
jgi:hypothetical protein